jgi:hypothetical protein
MNRCSLKGDDVVSIVLITLSFAVLPCSAGPVSRRRVGWITTGQPVTDGAGSEIGSCTTFRHIEGDAGTTM